MKDIKFQDIQDKSIIIQCPTHTAPRTSPMRTPRSIVPHLLSSLFAFLFLLQFPFLRFLLLLPLLGILLP
ncbi:Protein of unknown function [Pyronema omphalodes CBS 100304]|uniref:Uncharacterized protein n=1 Tax=Pyronema omphalodes (strain CBS 100304) TaxID=1076935 RepID=U4LPY4_PYROM|nr:Protein of unknown function [Pyronema omphalodes CBS 100304]